MLLLCTDCRRHFRASDASCPFCRAAAPTVTSYKHQLRRGSSRSAMSQASALFVASGALVAACDGASGEALSGGTGVSEATTGGASTTGTSTAGNPTGAAAGNRSGQGSGGGEGAQTGTSGSAGSLPVGDGGAGGDADGRGGTSTSGGPAGGAGSGGTDGNAGNGGENTGLGVGADCPGATPQPTTAELCRTAADCNGTGDVISCVMTATPGLNVRGCHPAAVPDFCTSDFECGDGRLCAGDQGGCAVCIDACTVDSCEASESCVDGRCVDKQCDEDGALACNDGQTCDPSSAQSDPHGCRPTRCDEPEYVPESCPASYACAPSNGTTLPDGCSAIACTEPGGECADTNVCVPENAGDGVSGCRAKDCSLGEYECAPNTGCSDQGTPVGYGCRQLTCATDVDCDCGYCVNGECEATLGFCEYQIAMPYGCVWPDEELV